MTKLPSHFFVSSADGGLYDTRQPNWSSKPVRADYCQTHTTIATVEQLKATLRSGPYAWPGGYPLYFITSDGAALSFDAVRQEFRAILASTRDAIPDGWQVIACAINYEDADLFCEHTNERIPSAYGSDE